MLYKLRCQLFIYLFIIDVYNEFCKRMKQTGMFGYHSKYFVASHSVKMKEEVVKTNQKKFLQIH